MNKNIFTIILIILLSLLQILMLPIFSIYSVVPNIILVVGIILILLDYEKEALYLAGLGGLVFDLFSPVFFGLMTIYLISLVFFLRYLVRKIFPHINILIVASVTFISAIILSLLIELILKERLSIIYLLVSGGYNAILAIIIFALINLQQKKLKMVKI